MRRLFCSFSGGETSAYMAQMIKTKWAHMWDEVINVFANTGQENEETLEFVDRCDRELGFNTVWVEAVVNPEMGKGTTHKVVTFETASRNGEPFEAMIKKYGIPNQSHPHCTRELKLYAMGSYLRSIGWMPGTYETAVGIRADESERRSKSAKVNNIIYPLMDMRPTTKPHVNGYWMSQPFRLELRGYQGNCKWCWKKSGRKLLTIMDDDASVFDFPERMEEAYGLIGAEFQKEHVAEYRRVFFRGNASTKMLREAYEKAKDTLDRAEDDAIVLPNGELFELDIVPEGESGCGDHCEPNFEELQAGAAA